MPGSPSPSAALVADAVPVATALVRTAGRLAGEALDLPVNLINPDALVVGGSLSTAEPLMAALRSALYERSLPPNTRDLTISTCRTGPAAALVGAAAVLLEEILNTL